MEQTNSAVSLFLIFSFSPRSDTTPLLNNSTQDRMFDTMSVEIEQLLAKVSPHGPVVHERLLSVNK